MAYFAFEPIQWWNIAIFTYDLQFILINIKNIKGLHYSWHLDEQFTVVFMTVSHSAQMLLKLEKCIPISHVTLETVPKYANIERPTSSQLYASRIK